MDEERLFCTELVRTSIDVRRYENLTKWLSHGEKVTAKAHGSLIDIEGVTVADLDANMKIVHLETWFEYVFSPSSCLYDERADQVAIAHSDSLDKSHPME
jgi:arginine deiminase